MLWDCRLHFAYSMRVNPNSMNAEKTTIKIRRAQMSDAAEIAMLLGEAFSEYRPLYTEKGFAATTPLKNEIEERIGKKAVWLVLLHDNLAGTVSIFPGGDGLSIRSMAVSPAARGKGIGKILMEQVHEMAFSNGCSTLRLNTTTFLLSAIRLYERFGFRKEGMGDLYGTPLIKMTKDLKQAIKTNISTSSI
jgi:ribosomal protein S18 acetylase RimI-like enzyme